jgi:hypothetical protein
VTLHLPEGDQTSIYDAAMKYQKEGTPLVVIAGKEYGTGSSRDWAAKGTMLLGVRAVIAESFERIHRSNLVGMGVLPLEFGGSPRSRRSIQALLARRAERARRERPRRQGRGGQHRSCAPGATSATTTSPPRPHWDVGAALGILDFERAAKLSGARFTVLWGAAARLERALIQLHARPAHEEQGYTEVLPPFLVKDVRALRDRPAPQVREDLFKTHKGSDPSAASTICST